MNWCFHLHFLLFQNMPSAATRDRVNTEKRIVGYVPAQNLHVNKNVIRILSVSDLILQMGSPVDMMLKRVYLKEIKT